MEGAPPQLALWSVPQPTLTTRAGVPQQHRSHPPTLMIVLAMNLRWSASHGDHRFDLRLDGSGLTSRYRSCSRFDVTRR